MARGAGGTAAWETNPRSVGLPGARGHPHDRAAVRRSPRSTSYRARRTARTPMTPITRAEASQFTETSLHADVMAFVATLRDRNDPRLRVGSIGTSAEGRDIPLLVLSSEGFATPEAAHASGRPVVLLQCGIHPGEVEGKEAGLALAHELLGGPRGALLERLTVVLLPLFNPDGNDRIDPGNRALHLPKLFGQLGPDSGVGTRTNAARINLNRDYLRADSAEMRLWHPHVWQAWRPHLTLDNHATNGSVHRMAMTVDVPHVPESGQRAPIECVREELVPWVIEAVRRSEGLDSGWYGNFVEDERCLDAERDVDPGSTVGEGWMTYPHHPRFGANYRGLCGRMDLLLEAYAYIPFADRVRVAGAWMRHALAWVAERPEQVRDLVIAAESPPEQVAVRYRLDTRKEAVEIRTRSPRTLEGSPTTVRLPHLARFMSTLTVQRPRAYLMPAESAARLAIHGLRAEAASGRVEVSTARVEGYGELAGRHILEAAGTGDVRVSWHTGAREVPPGWVRVRTDGPHGAVAVYLCEPESDDGPIENGIVAAPEVGGELPIWREG